MAGDLKFSVNTLGCKANLSESDLISRELLKKGFRMVNFDEGPDISIINTCTVTVHTDSKTRQLIRKIKSASRGKLMVTGCFTELNGETLKELGVDLIIRNKDKRDIPGVAVKLVGLQKTDNGASTGGTGMRASLRHSRPLVKIQDGCQQNCSYCIVPRVRGDYHSESAGSIIKEINYLQEEGFEEIILTGIHIGKYGADFSDANAEKGKPGTLAQLLDMIIRQTGIKRIRLSSIEISEFSGELKGIISKNKDRFAEHLHISLQSGSDKILKAMKRPYLKEFFFKKIKAIRNTLGDITITTDIIVGFPGESEDDFRQTLGLVREVSFSKLHVFKFSGRPDTPAAVMPGQVMEKVKSERSRILREAGDEIREDYLKHNIGKTAEIVCEEFDSKNNLLCGTSGNYIRVYIKANHGDADGMVPKGKMIKVSTGPRFRDGLSGIMKENF